MKKTAVLIYNSFCNFEFSVALEIITDNIITSISYNFVKWGLAFGRMIGIDIPPETFGI